MKQRAERRIGSWGDTVDCATVSDAADIAALVAALEVSIGRAGASQDRTQNFNDDVADYASVLVSMSMSPGCDEST